MTPTSVLVGWTAWGGTQPIKYITNHRVSGDAAWIPNPRGLTLELSQTIDGLSVNGLTYDLRIQGSNEAGVAFSQIVNFTTPVGAIVTKDMIAAAEWGGPVFVNRDATVPMEIGPFSFVISRDVRISPEWTGPTGVTRDFEVPLDIRVGTRVTRDAVVNIDWTGPVGVARDFVVPLDIVPTPLAVPLQVQNLALSNPTTVSLLASWDDLIIGLPVQGYSVEWKRSVDTNFNVVTPSVPEPVTPFVVSRTVASNVEFSGHTRFSQDLDGPIEWTVKNVVTRDFVLPAEFRGNIILVVDRVVPLDFGGSAKNVTRDFSVPFDYKLSARRDAAVPPEWRLTLPSPPPGPFYVEIDLGDASTLQDASGHVWGLANQSGGIATLDSVPLAPTAPCDILVRILATNVIWFRDASNPLLWRFWDGTNDQPPGGLSDPRYTSTPPVAVTGLTAITSDTTSVTLQWGFSDLTTIVGGGFRVRFKRSIDPNYGADIIQPCVGPGIGQFSDTAGRVFSVSTAGRVVVNGVPDNTTAAVAQLLYFSGQYWYHDTSGGWFFKVLFTDPWSASSVSSPTFQDLFTTLSINTAGPDWTTGNNWAFGSLEDPRNSTGNSREGSALWVNPLAPNQTMAVSNIIKVTNGKLQLGWINSPAGIASFYGTPFCGTIINDFHVDRKQFGYYSMVASFPKVNGLKFGWSIESTDGFPPEIDALDIYVDGSNNFHLQYHVFPVDWQNPFVFNVDLTSIDLTLPHVFDVDWQSTGIKFYIDGVQKYQVIPLPDANYSSKPGHNYIWTATGSDAGVDPSTGALPVFTSIDSFTRYDAKPSITQVHLGQIVSNLANATSFDFQVVAFNIAGNSPTSTVTRSTLSAPTGESPSGTYVPPSTQLIDALGNVWTISAGGQEAINGVPVADTGGVTLLEYFNHQVYQQNNLGAWYGPSSASTGGPNIPGDPRLPAGPAPSPPSTPPPSPTGIFTVNQANGFRDGSNTKWEFRGYNCWWGEYQRIKGALFSKFGGANFVRVVCDQGTTVANIQSMINELTARGVVCEIDYHDAVQGGTIGWYQTMTAAFKNNRMVFMETPNEPGGNVAQDQIDIINALRAAGWTSPIGLNLRGGFQFDNVGPVMSQISQNNQIFLTPHNYGDWWVGNMQNTANATGLYSIVDEFGDSTDGEHVDSNGLATVQHIIQTQQAHQNGAAVWSATNGYHEGDNMFADPDGNTLTSMGQLMVNMGWLN